jgi:DNA polymerase I
MKKTIIFDGSNLLHRCYWVAKSRPNLSVSQLFLNSLKKCTEKFLVDNIICVWDDKDDPEQKNFRQKSVVCEYKGTRDRERAKDVYSHCDAIRYVTSPLGVIHLSPGVLEADDYIFWLSKNLKNEDKIIVSSDGDMLQLVASKCTVYNPISNKVISKETFEESTGTTCVSDYIIYKSLIGDKSDNIIGVPKIGHQRALKLVSIGISGLPEPHMKTLLHNIELIDLAKAENHHPEEYALYPTRYAAARDKASVDMNKFKHRCIKHEIYSVANNMAEWSRVFDKTKTMESIVSKLIRLNCG